MGKVSNFPRPSTGTSSASTDPRSEKIAEAIKTLLSALSAPEQHRILQEIMDTISPPVTPRAGKVLGTIVRLLPDREEWTVSDFKQEVASEGVEATMKEIYNALGYLTRKGHIQRVGYGKYLIDGGLLVTAEDLGGEPSRYEDD